MICRRVRRAPSLGWLNRAGLQPAAKTLTMTTGRSGARSKSTLPASMPLKKLLAFFGGRPLGPPRLRPAIPPKRTASLGSAR